MPIYEYRREDGTTFEIMQSIADPALEKDPETGQKVQRVLHAPSIHFKGSGFYNTDYGTRRRAREAERSGNGDKSEAASTDAKGDANKAGAKGDAKKADAAPSKTAPGS